MVITLTGTAIVALVDSVAAAFTMAFSGVVLRTMAFTVLAHTALALGAIDNS
jgi:hypothetical protein